MMCEMDMERFFLGYQNRSRPETQTTTKSTIIS